MSADLSRPPLGDVGVFPEPARPQTEHADKERKKHKNRVRSAWISFIGRIVAQIAGAAATIVLGLAVLNQYNTGRGKSDASQATPPKASAADPRQRDFAPIQRDVAVLPFENYSGDAAQDYLADGLTDALIDQLSQIDGLRIVSRTSSMHYKGLRTPLPDVAAELRVAFVVEGSVVSQNGRTRVSARLINAMTDRKVWSRVFDVMSPTVFALDTDVAGAIARNVQAVVASFSSGADQ